ncbi:uncharacterized protein LOC123274197 [Cotesia glomerata]|nr:uncharacterized protein LOC123274197 [Cotesia glomerata]
MDVIMNDFKIIMNDEKEYCLKFIASEIMDEYDSLFQNFKKEFINEKELENLFENRKDDENVRRFKKKISLLKRYKWINDVDSLIKERDSDIKINKIFIQIWDSLKIRKYITISNDLLEFIGFSIDGNTDNHTHLDGIPRKRSKKDIKSEYVKFLQDNKIDFKNEATTSTNEPKIYLAILDFRKSVQKLNNNKKSEIITYLSEIESLFNYQKLAKLEADNKKLAEDNKVKERQVKSMKNVIGNIKVNCKDGYIYIATSDRYALENKFKVGRTDQPKKRLATYNSGRSKDDLFYYCFCEPTYGVKNVENMILDLLKSVKEQHEKEMFIIHHTWLIQIIKDLLNNIGKSYEYFNELVQKKLLKMYSLRPSIPVKLDASTIESIENYNLKETIVNILDNYIETSNLNLTKKTFLQDVKSKLSVNIVKTNIWSYFKKNFKWESKGKVLSYKKQKITITIVEKYRNEENEIN